MRCGNAQEGDIGSCLRVMLVGVISPSGVWFQPCVYWDVLCWDVHDEI